MAITVICSNCSRQYRVRDERAGAEFRCRSCQAKISVPLPVNVSAGQPPTTRSRRTPARFRQPAWLVGAGVITVLVVTVAFVFLPAKPEAPERAADSNGSGPRQQETSLASADSSGRELSMDDGAAASSHRGGDQTSATVTESGESAAASDSDVSEIIFPPSRSVSQPSADSAAVADSEQMERRPEKPAQVVQPAELTGPPKGEPAGDEEFVGPFASWFDLKRDFGALGDGQADDTAALQRALDELAQGDNRRGENRCVLFLPAGTYRITSGLTMVNRVGLGVIGEHPERTKILWDGPGGDGVCMLHCNGVHHSRFGRITWDGAGKDVTAVAHEWDGKSGSGATYLEHSDEVFQDMTFGIRAGIQMLDSEVAVTRCRFLRASDSGVRLQSFNALDWWFWDCEFTDCQTGLRNEPGGGHFHVYRCLFQRSRSADLHVGHTSYFGIRHNVSVGSNNFLYCEFRTSRAAICLQNNRVIDAGDARTILVNNMGPLVLIDNTFITGPQPENRPVIAMNVKSPQDFDLISIGNRYSYPRLNVQGRHFAMDESVFQPKPIDLKIPKLPGTPENRNRHVIEVPPGASGEEIQSAI
ncbi:hypothetical protein GC176_27360, partial [bacterium]|nr:hypothetical protein [bacterium]